MKGKWGWLRPGLYFKRWIFLGLVGLFGVIGSFVLFIEARNLPLRLRMWVYVGGSALIVLGCIAVYFAILRLYQTINSVNRPAVMGGQDARPMNDRLYQQRALMKGPRVVAIGGGTGLPTLLRGMKRFTSNITAVVTVADDGGGSGNLRSDMGIIPPGDIRNCILALADAEPVMERLFQYRFKDGALKGQSFGNLFIAAMSEVSGGFMDAIQQTSDVLAVTGRVLPVTLEDVRLCARMDDGSSVQGESAIPAYALANGARVRQVYLDKPCRALGEVLEELLKADIIVMGPGSLYTSVLPNFCVQDLCDAIRASRAVKIYACNIMTQPGETLGYKASDHVRAVLEHCGRGIVNNVLVNDNMEVPAYLLERYQKEGAALVKPDRGALEKLGVRVFGADLVDARSDTIRHSAMQLGQSVMDIYRQVRFIDSVIHHKTYGP